MAVVMNQVLIQQLQPSRLGIVTKKMSLHRNIHSISRFASNSLADYATGVRNVESTSSWHIQKRFKTGYSKKHLQNQQNQHQDIPQQQYTSHRTFSTQASDVSYTQASPSTPSSETSGYHPTFSTLASHLVHKAIDDFEYQMYINNVSEKNRIITPNQSNAQWKVVNPQKLPSTLVKSIKHSPKRLENVPGVYGYPGLHQPRDFETITQKARTAVENIAKRLDDPTVTPHEAIEIVDTISTVLCDAADMMELARNSHDDSIWREAAYTSWLELQNVFSIFSTNPKIGQVIIDIAKRCVPNLDADVNNTAQITTKSNTKPKSKTTSEVGSTAKLSQEEIRIISKLYTRFTAFEGCSPDVCDFVSNATDLSYELEREYSENLQKHSLLSLQDIKAKSILQYCPHLTDAVKQLGNTTYVRIDPYTCANILQHVPDNEIRKLIYYASLKLSRENLKILSQYILMSQENSNIVDYKSFAHNSLQTEVAKSPENVIRFLEILRRYVTPLANNELLQMRKSISKNVPQNGFKKGVNTLISSLFGPLRKSSNILKNATTTSNITNSNDSSNSIFGPRGVKGTKYEHGLDAWDIPFAQQLSLENNISPDIIHEYFSYQVFLDALQVLSTDILNLELIAMPLTVVDHDKLTNSESWTNNTTVLEYSNLAISKYEVVDRDTKQHYGTLFLDIFPREGKVGGAATFTLASGKDTTKDDYVFVSSGETADSKRRKAVATMVCNFSPQPSSNPVTILNDTLQQSSMIYTPSTSLSPVSEFLQKNGTKEDIENVEKLKSLFTSLNEEEREKMRIVERIKIANHRSILLSFEDFVTLLHEFGHALNSILSTAKYQYLSGVRYEIDFVETPSTFMENFAVEPEFLKRVAKHYLTNEPIPDEYINLLQQQLLSDKSLSILKTASIAAVDQRLYGLPAEYDPNTPFPWVDLDINGKNNNDPTSYKVRILQNDECLTMEELEDEIEHMNFTFIENHNPLIPPNTNPKDDPYNTHPTTVLDKKTGKMVPYVVPTYRVHPRKQKKLPRNVDEVYDDENPRYKSLFGNENLQIVNQILEHYSVAKPSNEVVYPHAHTAHLLNYSAAYYTYVYCEAFSRAIYNKLFLKNPFNKEAGKLFRQHILSPGGKTDPLLNLAKILGIKGVDHVEKLTLEQQNALFNAVMKNFILFLKNGTTTKF